jgi:hypothetical protein
MTFGGTPSPSMWGYISDTLADIGNMIIQNANCDPLTLYNKISDSLEPPKPLDDMNAFHPAKDLAIDIPVNDIGKVNIYINDSIGIALDQNNNLIRVSHAIPQAIRAISRAQNHWIRYQEKI